MLMNAPIHSPIPSRIALATLAMLVACASAAALSPAVLTVGPGRRFATVAAAMRVVHPGDTIKVWPLAHDQPYQRVAVQVDTPDLTIEAARRHSLVKLSGAGFNYSGRGSTPRAIFQFNPHADHCTLIGFDLSGAHNHSFNGAGVRINAANHVTIRDCYIHANDMGIMSNGSLSRHTGAAQVVEDCHITRNGNEHQPGYNHNLYMGGTSVLIYDCDISRSLTGHNVKSRAHLTIIQYCYIHDSDNREIDLVDARGNTDRPHSDALILGCLIVKKPHMSGNHEVINFGRDGAANHTGTLYMVHDTVITPYPTAVVTLSAPGARLVMIDNKIQTRQHRATLVALCPGIRANSITGRGNRIAAAFGPIVRKLNGAAIRWNQIKLPWSRWGISRGLFYRYAGWRHLVRVRGRPRHGQ